MSEMNWTTEKPTIPGLYWYRQMPARNPGPFEVDPVFYEPDVVKVESYDGRLRMNFHDDDHWYPVRDGEWAGPLEPPR